jgi:hypothetical protein
MTKSVLIAVAVAALVGGTSLATAKTRGAAHRNPSHPGNTETTHRNPSQSGITETGPAPTVANPYYRLSDQYYDYPDPYRGLYGFFAVPPYIPGYTYGHVKMPLR